LTASVALGFEPTPKASDPWTVDKVLEQIPGGPPAEGSSSPLPFFHMLERLKTTKREGWRRFEIERYGFTYLPRVIPQRLTIRYHSAESIADHMYRMSLLTLLAPPALLPKLDLHKCMKMALVHDMAESLVGDITPVDGLPKPEKSRREAETMDYLTKRLLGNVFGGAAGADIRAIWQEYEDSKTTDSHFVHDMDKMELLLQMMEYERRGRGYLDLGEFAYVATKMTLPETKAWADELLKERDEFWGSKQHVHGEAGVKGGIPTGHQEKVDDYYSRE
jgi:putative hydrolase of HD superfamily